MYCARNNGETRTKLQLENLQRDQVTTGRIILQCVLKKYGVKEQTALKYLTIRYNTEISHGDKNFGSSGTESLLTG
jgi:hypothetical protein